MISSDITLLVHAAEIRISAKVLRVLEDDNFQNRSNHHACRPSPSFGLYGATISGGRFSRSVSVVARACSNLTTGVVTTLSAKTPIVYVRTSRNATPAPRPAMTGAVVHSPTIENGVKKRFLSLW